MFRRFLPHMRVNAVYDIALDELQARGMKGIITDLDNTLVGARDPIATPELVAWLDRVREFGFKVVIVSNNNETRVSAFAEPIGIPFIHAARKPASRAFRRALEVLELPPEHTVVIGDQLLTDVLGGRSMGLFTILVNAIAPHDEGRMTKFNRRLEKVVRASLRRRGLWDEEDKKK